MTKVKRDPVKSNPMQGRFYGTLLITLFLLLICGAMSIPFVYQSQTLWYKVGIDKIMLYGGQMAGLLAAMLLFVQILLGARGKFLADLFGVAALVRWHRLNGFLICLFAFGHITLVLVPEGIANLPIGKKHWPEMIGGGLFLIIVSMAISSHFREELGLAYKRWRAVHRTFGYLSLLLVTVHILYVSESFQQDVPKAALLALLVVIMILVLLGKKELWLGQWQQKK